MIWTYDQTCMQVSTHSRPVAPEKPIYEPSVEEDVLAACQLYSWRIRGYIHDTPRSIDARYERRGWFGLTVNNYSAVEHVAIKAWAKDKGSDTVYLSRKDKSGGEMWVEHFIGEYQDYCVNLWFATEELLLEFCAMLKSFPPRTTAMLVKNLTAAMQFIKDLNYIVLTGTKTNAIGLPEMDPTNLMLLRLAAT